VLWLALTLIVAVLGALGGGYGGFRLLPRLGSQQRGRIARRAVALLCALAGAEIATQLVHLAQQLEQDSAAGHAFSGGAGPLQTFDLAIAFRQILFSGCLLIGLAALVGLAATRRYGERPG
jgi:hypothetical protein